MPASIKRAVILAAGRGTRMGQITESLPKPMLRVAGRPMLEHIMDRLASTGIDEFLIVVGYHHQAIQSYFCGSRYNITFRVQEPINGTGSAALLARDFCAAQPFLLTFGDILCSPTEYLRAFSLMDDDTQAALAVKAVDDPWQGAAVYEQSGRITRIVEKPPKGSSTTPWNSAGFYCFQPVVFDYLRKLTPSVRNEYELTSAIDAMLASGLTIRISPIEGEWRDVGRPEDLAAVNSKAF